MYKYIKIPTPISNTAEMLFSKTLRKEAVAYGYIRYSYFSYTENRDVIISGNNVYIHVEEFTKFNTLSEFDEFIKSKIDCKIHYIDPGTYTIGLMLTDYIQYSIIVNNKNKKLTNTCVNYIHNIIHMPNDKRVKSYLKILLSNGNIFKEWYYYDYILKLLLSLYEKYRDIDDT